MPYQTIICNGVLIAAPEYPLSNEAELIPQIHATLEREARTQHGRNNILSSEVVSYTVYPPGVFSAAPVICGTVKLVVEEGRTWYQLSGWERQQWIDTWNKQIGEDAMAVEFDERVRNKEATDFLSIGYGLTETQIVRLREYDPATPEGRSVWMEAGIHPNRHASLYQQLVSNV